MRRSYNFISTWFAALVVLWLTFSPRAFSQTITIRPSTATVKAGNTQSFTASWPNGSGVVTWSVNGIVGGNSSVGTINSSGLYTAPANINSTSVTVGAAASANPPTPGTASVTLQNPAPTVTSITPTQINTGWNSFVINGRNFVTSSSATFGTQTLAVTYISSTQLQFVGNISATAGTTAPLTVTNPNDGSVSSSISLTVQPAITVTISPTTATVYPNATQNFTATISNTSNKTINWLVNGIPGGNAAVGTIVVGSTGSQGVYTAPATPPNPNVVSIQAQSAQNTAVLSPASQVTLSGPSITVSPSSPAPRPGATVQFSASVKGLSSSTVTWSVNGVPGGTADFGTITSGGLYTAPAGTDQSSVTVQAVSTVDGVTTGTATVTLTNPTIIISSVSPGVINSGFSTNTITGQGFVQGLTATLGTTPLTVVYNSSTSVVVSGTTSATVGSTVSLTLTNPNPNSTSASRNYTVMAPITVSVSPATATVQAGASQTFTANVQNTTNRAVNWFVNGVSGGNAAVGTITSSGTYTAPATVPQGSISIQAQSQQNPAIYSSPSSVTVTPLSATITSASPNPMNYGPVVVQVQGSGFVPGAQVVIGNAPLVTTFISSTQLTATGVLAPVVGQMAELTVVNPGSPASNGVVVSFQTANPQMSYETAYHFLEQATWGPTPADIQNLQQIGFSAWFAQQAAAPLSTYTATATGMSTTQSEFFTASLTGQDQLRQRVAFALSAILCVSALKEATPSRMVPYLQLLETDALGNYYQLLQDMTLAPTMGEYLNMADNYMPQNGGQPNQNYARELMQLFSIGTYMLNMDGSLQLDGNGNPIPTYTETTIQNFSRMLTGWTFAPAPGAPNLSFNPSYFGAPMVAWEAYHDTGSKTLLNGLVTQAGQSAEADLQTALQNIYSHQNVAPFVSYRLIQHLVESNPSPAYVQRIANVFNDDGTGTKGNLMAVVQAILLDPEARDSDEPGTWLPNGGHLREPVLYINSVLRALNTTLSGPNQLGAAGGNMGEFLFSPSSVFSFYTPVEPLPGYPTLYGPEFYILNSATGMATMNWVNSTVDGSPGAGAGFDLSPFLQFANDPQSLVTAISNAFMAGQMPAPIQSAILTALASCSDPNTTVQTALYLALASPFYLVQR